MKIYLSDATLLNVGYREIFFLSKLSNDAIYDFSGQLLHETTTDYETIEFFLSSNEKSKGKWEIFTRLTKETK